MFPRWGKVNNITQEGIREAAKKNNGISLVARPLRGGRGGLGH